MFSKLDISLRDFFSFFYRILIAVYGYFIHFHTETPFLAKREYLATIVVYVVASLFLKHKWDKPFLRLLLDAGFIGVSLITTDLTIYYNFFFLLIPLLNMQNHSSKKSTWVTFPVVLVLGLLLHYFDCNEISPSFLFPFVVSLIILFLIDGFARMRAVFQNLNDVLFELIDEFYARSSGRKRASLIYKTFINKVNTIKYARWQNIETIACFVRRNDELVLVNASQEIFEFNISNEIDLISTIDKGSKNFPSPIIEIDEVVYTKTAFVPTIGNKRSYYFIVIFNLQSPLEDILNYYFLGPAMKHLARLFEIQHYLNRRRIKSINSIQRNHEYVLKANEVMHFVKNSLSPVKDALALSEEYHLVDDIEMKAYLLDELTAQRKTGELEIRKIIEQANYILGRSKNPFEATKIESISTSLLLNEVRLIWSERFDDARVSSLTIQVADRQVLKKGRCQIDAIIFQLVLVNILSNIEKHGGEIKDLQIHITEEFITFGFKNSIKKRKKEELTSLNRIVGDYNEENRAEIARRDSHGLEHLKIYVDSLKAYSRIEVIEGESFLFELIIPIYYD